MHLAIVIESSYAENTQLSELPGAHASAELVSTSLTQAGFVVERVPASRELAAYLDERLLGAATPFQSLLVYYAGYVALNPERGPALLLDGARLRAFPVSRLGRSIMTAAYSGALVIDAVAVTEPGQTAEEVAEAVADIVPQEGRVSTVVAAREPRNALAWMPSRFSDLFVIGLDWLQATGAEPASITLRSLLSVMREERVSYSLVGAIAEELCSEEFTLLPARTAARPSGPVRSLSHDAVPPSDPVTSWAPSPVTITHGERPLPSFDDPRPLAPDPEAHRGHRPLPSFDDPEVSGERAAALPSFDDSQATALPSFDDSQAARLPSFEEPGFAGALEQDAARAPESAPPPSFDDARDASALDENDDASVERSSVLPSPAARRELASRPGRQLVDPETLAALVAAFDRDEQHAEAVDAREQLARCLGAEPARRAYILEEAARIAANRLGDGANAVRLAREALDVDPTSLGALDVVTTELAREEAWQELADVYERVLLRLADGPIAGRIASHLGTILQARLGNTDGALLAFGRALSSTPDDASLHRKLAEIHEGRGDVPSAVAYRRSEAKAAPRTTGAYAAAVALFAAAGDMDGAWNAASALVALDGADEDVRALYDSYRDNGLLQVQRGLSYGDWASGLLEPERDEEVAELFRAVHPSAVRVRLDHLTRARALPDLPDSSRHDPEKSTAMLARSLLWTSKLLGVEPPSLYVIDGLANHMMAAPAAARTSLVSRSLASGLALGELSFLWARHLTFQRESHQLLTFYPTAKELTNLIVAAKAVGSPETRSVDFLDADAKELAKALRRVLDDGAERKLAERVRSLSPDGLAERAFGWAHGVELVAGRVGLLACGDVVTATNLVARFPLPGLVSPSDQVEDLLAYAISAEYGELRSRLGAQIRARALRTG